MLSRSARARPQSVGSVLGGHRVDEEATPPFEPGHSRELGNDLEMPVEGLELDFAERRRVQHEVEGRVAEHPVHAAEELAERSRSEEHTSELQSRLHLVCRLLLEKKKTKKVNNAYLLRL